MTKTPRPIISRESLAIGSALALILVFIAWSFRQFSNEASSHTHRMNEQRLGDIALQIADTLKLEFDSARENIEFAASAFGVFSDIFQPESRKLLLTFRNNSTFGQMWIVDVDGKAINADGDGMRVPTEVSERLRRIDGRVFWLKHSYFDGQSVFGAHAPIFRDGERVGSVAGTFLLRSLVALDTDAQFGGEGYVDLFDEEGVVLFRSHNRFNLLDKENIWDFFAQVDITDGESLDQMRRSVRRGGTGIVYYRVGGERRIGFHAPLGIDNWHLFSRVTEDVAKRYSRSIDHLALRLLLKVLPCFLLLLAGAVYYYAKGREKLIGINRMLNFSNQRFRAAASHLSDDVVEYDIAHDVLYRITGDAQGNADAGVNSVPIDDLARNLIKGRTIEPSSMRALQEALDRLYDGAQYSSCLLKVSDGTGERREWYNVVFTVVPDLEDEQCRAIGTIEDVTNEKETELRLLHDELQHRAVMADVLETFVSNLTRERFLYSDGKSHADDPDAMPGYTAELERLVRAKVVPEDQEMMLHELSLRELRRKFRQGISKIETEFRTNDPERGVRWVRCTTNLIVDMSTDDLISYSYAEDVTESKLSYLALQRQAERDALTGLYNRQASERLIEEFLAGAEQSGHAGVSAVLLVDLDRFKTINDTYGHAAGDEALRRLAGVLTGVFRDTDIVGRIGGDEFVVFVKNVKNAEAVFENAARVCQALKTLRIDADPGHVISGSVGVCLVPEHGRDWPTLYARADSALYAAKAAGKDRYVVYGGDETAGLPEGDSES